MARTDSNVVLCRQQPTPVVPQTSKAEHANNVLMVLNIAERMPIFSQDIIDAANEGEPYEKLTRMVEGLHHNLAELSELAEKAKVSPIG
ncbi:MAG: hypothetical protein AB2784_21795 [Candidatus Thiodiazotropha endolucinida]